jgi:NitT/TauT family transport system substrate-binding protein
MGGLWNRLSKMALLAVALLGMVATAQAQQPLRIIYSDWPGWVAWEIALQKGWFDEAGVKVEFLWFDYGAGLDAFAAGQADGYSATNGDALVIGATAGAPSVCILINDFSNGNDMLIARPGISTIEQLKGRNVGAEVGFVSHLLLLHALRSANVDESEVTVTNMANNELPNALASAGLDAISAWQPASGQALRLVPGATTLFTSAEAPGIIYDCLYVTPQSLATRRAEWVKVVEVWYRVMDFVADESNRDEVLKVLSARVDLSPHEYAPLLAGSHLLPMNEVLPIWEDREGLDSIYGSSRYVDAFNVEHEVYEKLEFTPRYIDASLTLEVARKRGDIE